MDLTIEEIDSSIEDALAKHREDYQEYNERKRGRGRKCLESLLKDLEEDEQILTIILHNYERIAKHSNLSLKLCEDGNRVLNCIRSTYRVKWTILYYCFEAFIGSILMMFGFWNFGYPLNLIAVLKIQFAFLAISTIILLMLMFSLWHPRIKSNCTVCTTLCGYGWI